MPPMPIAASRLIAPVGTTSTRTRGASAPMRMIEPLPHLHFEERDQPAAAGDEVDLSAPHAEAVRDDVPPLRLQVGDRLLLTGEAILVALVRPRGRVAA